MCHGLAKIQWLFAAICFFHSSLGCPWATCRTTCHSPPIRPWRHIAIAWHVWFSILGGDLEQKTGRDEEPFRKNHVFA